ncbi:hypothetical protein Tco_0640073 [Tanacetum coccineum]
MFRDILHFPVETLENPFVAPVNIETIEAFMNKVGYQGVVDKVSTFYTKNLAQPWQTMFKVFNRCLTKRTSGHDLVKINILQLFHIVINRTNVDYTALLWWDFMNNIPQRIEEDYHSIKDDIQLVSVYTARDVCIRGMLIPDAFLTKEICATDDFKESIPRAHRTPTLTASPQGKKRNDDRERDEIVEATLLSLTLHKIALAAEAQENIAKVQEKLAEEEIEKMVEGDKYEESYASEFADSVLNDDVDDFGTRLEPIEKEKKADEETEKEKNNDNVEETDKVVKEKDIVDDVTVIPKVLIHCNKVVPDITFAKTKEMITQEMPCLVNLVVNKDHKVDPIHAKEMIAKEFETHRPKMIEELFQKHMQNTTFNLYPTTSTSTAGKSSANLQHQLYLNMKSKPQDQVADPAIWEILKAKFKK